MSEITTWINIVLFILLSLGIFCFVAAFADSIRMMFSGVFSIFARPFSIIQERTSSYLNNIKIWILKQLEDESEHEGDGPVYYIIGSILYSILTVFFILCDFGMILLTAEAMGLDKVSIELPLDTSTLTAVTLVTTSLFFGMLFFDLVGVTFLTPLRKSLSVGFRRTFMALSVFFFLSSVFIGVSMAYWRGYTTVQFIPEAEASVSNMDLSRQDGLNISEGGGIALSGMESSIISEEEMPPMDTSKNWIVYACLMGISGLSISATAFSVVGLVILFKFLILMFVAICALPLLPVTFVTWFISLILNLVFNAIERVIDFFVQVGNAILRFFRWHPADSVNQAVSEGTGTEDSAEEDSIKAEHDPSESAQPDPGFNPFPGR